MVIRFIGALVGALSLMLIAAVPASAQFLVVGSCPSTVQQFSAGQSNRVAVVDIYGNNCFIPGLWNGSSYDPATGLLVGTAGAPAADVVTVQSPITLGSAGFPAASTPITASSGNVAAATATATLAANATKTTYICGLSITSTGSTAAAVVSPTVTGVITGTMTLTYASVAGATLSNQPLVIPFTPCVPGSAINTAIAVALPSLGAGNTNATVSAWGFQQ